MLGLFAQHGFLQSLPDIFHSLVGRVQHVLSVEAVVAQFVVDNFVCREIVYGWSREEARGVVDAFLCSKQQRGFGELAGVIAVFCVAYGKSYADARLS